MTRSALYSIILFFVFLVLGIGVQADASLRENPTPQPRHPEYIPAEITPLGVDKVDTRPGGRGGAQPRHCRPASREEIEIAQYGEYEDQVTFRNTGFKAVRFDPPLDPPYTITRIAFPSLTMNGVPAIFPSVRLCEAGPFPGFPNVNSPLFQITSYVGSADGINEIPVNISVADSGKTFYWCVEFPSSVTATFPNDYPFMRMDYTDLDRGLFANSYDVPPNGFTTLSIDRNIIVSMYCKPGVKGASTVPPSSNLGANRRLGDKTEFTFLPSGEERARGARAAFGSSRRTDLLYRGPFGPWAPFASAGPGVRSIIAHSIPNAVYIWTTQAVDRRGRRASTSSVTITSLFIPGLARPSADDADEPNGAAEEATLITPPVELRFETYWPAGDKDFFTFDARAGDVIQAGAALSNESQTTNLDLVMLLLDEAGRAVAFNDNSNGGPNPSIRYTVPRRWRRGGADPLRYIIMVTDVRGSFLSPRSAPRVVFPRSDYVFHMFVTPPPAAAEGVEAAETERFAFRTARAVANSSDLRMEYFLPSRAAGQAITVRIFDPRGRLVRSLVNEVGSRGSRVLAWDRRDDRGMVVSTGIYYALLECGDFRGTQQLAVLK